MALTIGATVGSFIVELIPGTVEEGNPLDSPWTDEEYATHPRDLARTGRLGDAAAFPAVHRAEAADPRVGRYTDASIRPWFVVFDGDASAYASGSIDTAWYADRGYLVVMTDAHGCRPPSTGPTRPNSRHWTGRRCSPRTTPAWCPLTGMRCRTCSRRW